jgi:hypothetical protein
VAEGFDVHFNDQGKNGAAPRKPTVIPFDSGRKWRNDFPPIEAVPAESKVSPVLPRGPRPGKAPGAGPIFLLAIAVLCGLYTGLTYKKSTAKMKPAGEQQAVLSSQPLLPVPPQAKPSPIPQADTARAGNSVVADQAHSAAKVARPAMPHDRPLRYEATHKKAFGGCTGELELTSDSLRFKCPSEADLDIPIASIAKVHKDGVVLASGEKYHFLIANHTKDQVEAIFILWLNTAQRSQI